MKVSNWFKIALSCFGLLFILCSCIDQSSNKNEISETDHQTEEMMDTAEDSMDILQTANAIMYILDQQNYRALSTYISKDGIMFSPYTFLDSSVVLLSKVSFVNALDSGTVFMWGFSDGKGDSILMNLENYFNEYVYDADFANADTISINSFVGSGNSINNIAEKFPQDEFVEYHFLGSEEYSNMDWKSLILLFEKENGKYFLRGLIHNEWTI